ncbi:hypothetical protein RY280_23580 [Bacillus paralicheniformis]|uniref:hypothetical protein n=1 Tax=Bacillus paralicheniformis TaxID=1648923 RepID=UPI00203F5703|nr:hypothetical protein [Bacillus paralicheniformis]MCM3425579.1 hypothetical protein [Bacillus paralicheniformis]
MKRKPLYNSSMIAKKISRTQSYVNKLVRDGDMEEPEFVVYGSTEQFVTKAWTPEQVERIVKNFKERSKN